VDSKIQSSRDIIEKRKKFAEFILDETQVKVKSRFIWIGVAIEPKN
jgi:hypothetical protein